jgi:hypothetical protein
LNQPTKFGLLKNLLYNDSQSPLTIGVRCGPLDSRERKKSSIIKGFTFGAARYGEIFLAKGIRLVRYLSKGIMNVEVNSRKCLRIKADCTALGRFN